MIDFFNDNNWLRPGRSVAIPAVNISEDDKAYTVDLQAPGFKKEDFEVNADDNTLTISAQKSMEEKEDNKEYSRREFSCSSFTRSFNLPDNAKADNIEASYADGILQLKIPKDGTQKAKSAKTIPIK